MIVPLPTPPPHALMMTFDLCIVNSNIKVNNIKGYFSGSKVNLVSKNNIKSFKDNLVG
jgi:hypothetical protein